MNYDNTYHCLEPKAYRFTVSRRYGLATEDFSGFYGTTSLGGMSYGSQNGNGFNNSWLPRNYYVSNLRSSA